MKTISVNASSTSTTKISLGRQMETVFSNMREMYPEELEKAQDRMRKILEEEDLQEKLCSPECQQKLKDGMDRAAEELRKSRQDSGSSLED